MPVARVDADMWMRDAMRRDRFSTIDKLDDPTYFPYRYGQPLTAGGWSLTGASLFGCTRIRTPTPWAGTTP
jgi:hypothetical protein